MKDKYADKPVDPSLYQILKIDGAAEPKELPEEEFRSGKPGIVWLDNYTGKPVFKKRDDNQTPKLK